MKAVINQIIDIKLSSNYQYILGESIIESLRDHIGIRHDQKILLLSDNIVWDLYGAKIENSFSLHPAKVEKVILDSGEEEKNFTNLYRILEKLAERGFTKTDVLVAIGGGVIGDIGGLAAALYMRGIAHVMVPTTTLAAIDSSVGGKTAVNLPQGKNLVGAFKQPSRVICDVNCFDTLSDRIFNEGLAEALKMAFINDYAMLNLFDKNLRIDKACLQELIAQAVKGKYNKVKNDEFDKGVRQQLNFGHTLAHAIEQLSNYEVRHGEAVAIGMLYMTKLSERKGLLDQSIQNKRLKEKFGDISPSQLLEKILISLNLPIELQYTYGDLQKYLLLDKKNQENSLNLIMLEDLGKAKIINVEKDKLGEYLEL